MLKYKYEYKYDVILVVKVSKDAYKVSPKTNNQCFFSDFTHRGEVEKAKNNYHL